MFVVALTLCYIAYFLWTRYRKALKNSPKFVPLIKCTKILFLKLDLWSKALLICKLVQNSGGVCCGYFYERGLRGLYVITDPEDSMTALKACTEKDYSYEYWKPWLGVAAFIGSAQVNKVHRKFFSTSLMPSNMVAFIKYFNVHSERFVKKLTSDVVGKGPVDMSRLLRMYNLVLLCDTMLAFEDLEKVNLDQYLDAVSNFVRITAHRFETVWLQHDFIFKWTALKKKQDAAIKILHHTSNEMIRQRRQKLKEIREKKCDPPGHELLIDVLLDVADKGIITDAAMKAEVDGTIFAGHDTSAYTMLYALVLLGSYPEVQERAFQEIRNVLGDRIDVTKEDLSKMVYIEAIIKESMRMYPYVVILPRRLDEEVRLKNCTLAVGCTVAVFVWAVHRNECWGPDAEVFRPERWLEPDKLPKPTVMLGFAEGARNCIGRRYAMLSMKTLMTHLIRNFRFTADHTKLKLEFVGVLEPHGGHEISVERRVSS